MAAFLQGIGLAEIMIILATAATIVLPVVLLALLIKALRRRP
jgi:hypothetical protein